MHGSTQEKTSWTIYSLHPSNECTQDHTHKKSAGGQTMSTHTPIIMSLARKKKKKKNDNKLLIT